MNQHSEEPRQAGDSSPSQGKKRWFGRGIYTKDDAPIKVLDKVIAGLITITVVLILWNVLNGGFIISFNTQGGEPAVADQKVKHSQLVAEPEPPVKPGYDLIGWGIDPNSQTTWDFSTSTVSGDMTLYALWTPSRITVKFDLNGGTVNGSPEAEAITVTYGGTYGELPVPQKEGQTFAGWLYSGTVITADTTVTMTGEHVLTAQWK